MKNESEHPIGKPCPYCHNGSKLFEFVHVQPPPCWSCGLEEAVWEGPTELRCRGCGYMWTMDRNLE